MFAVLTNSIRSQFDSKKGTDKRGSHDLHTVWNSVGLRMIAREFEFKFLDDNIVLFHCGHLPANYA